MGSLRKLSVFMLAGTLLSLACLPAGAQGDTDAGPRAALEEITLQQALGRALETHPQLVQAQLQLRAAEHRAEGDRSLLAPRFSFDINQLHNEDPIQGLFEDGIVVSDVIRAQTQIAKRTSWGMDMSIQLSASSLESERPFANPFTGDVEIQRIGPNVQQTLSMTLQQPVLKGFGSDVQLATAHLSTGQRDSARITVSQRTEQAVLEVITAWMELSFSQRSVNVRLSQLEISAEQREATEALVAAGSLAEIELDVVEQRSVALEESLLVAQNELKSRRAELASLLGAEPSTQLRAAGSQRSEPPVGEAQELVEMARQRSKALALVREQIKAQRIAAGLSEDAISPQLDLVFTAGLNALSEDGFFDALGQIASLEANQVTAGVLFSMPLGNGRARAQHRADMVEIQRLESALKDNSLQLDKEVRGTLNLVALGQKRLALSQRGVTLCVRTLKAEQSKFRAGMSTNQQVLQFQEELERAQERALRTEVDLELATMRLHLLTGTLLDAFALEPRP